MNVALIVPTTVRHLAKSQTCRSLSGGEASQVRSGVRKCVFCMDEVNVDMRCPTGRRLKPWLERGAVGEGVRAA